MNIDFKKITVNVLDSVLKTMHTINEGSIGAALIVDENGKYFGLVTDGDIRRALLAGTSLHDAIGPVANRNAVVVREGTPGEEIIALMTEKIRHIPVLDKEGHIKDLAYFSYSQSIPIARPFLKGNELKYVTECVLGNWISSSGRYIIEFEECFAQFCKTKYSLAVSNGTVALHLALVAHGIGPGDEVIVPALTFIATANAVTYSGAKPVFVDSEMETYNLDPAKLEALITKKTKAIIPVHLYGQPALMDEIMAIARKHKLVVIEDAAEAHGALYKGRKVGSIGDVGCFSFFGNKIITTGEGGMLVTNDQEFYERAKILRDHGMSPKKKYWHEIVGFNYRMTNLQAAIGLAQMEKVELILEEKIRIARMYTQNLAGSHPLILPPENEWSRNVFWMYPIVFKDSSLDGCLRQKVMAQLGQNKIEVRPFFYSIPQMPPYKLSETFDVAERLSRDGLVLPSYVGIQNSEVLRICESIKTCLPAKRLESKVKQKKRSK